MEIKKNKLYQEIMDEDMLKCNAAFVYSGSVLN